ncbi:fimbrial assembly protein [Zobellella aerophila]|uniref:Fimbrial assembly protein n=1 Tax=Zobellella aerophila TaxID=870480 RepID=A0ABP6VBR9_9GAMM
MKQRVEFYQASLRPRQESPSLRWWPRGALVIGIVWLLIFALTGLDVYRKTQEHRQLSANAEATQANLDRLRQGVSLLSRSQDEDERHRLEQNIRERRQLLGLLSSDNLVSYGGILSDLASVPWRDLSLQGLTLDGSTMTLTGYARDARAVPAWILGFKQTDSLRGRDFGQLEIRQGQDELLFFSLHSEQQASR